MQSHNMKKLKDLTEKLSKVPSSKRDSTYYEDVADLAKIRPEPGYELLESAAIGVHLVDGKGNVLWANSFELKTLNYKADEYFGKNISEFHMDSDVIEHILETLSGGGMLDAYPARLKSRDGDIIHVLINSNVFKKNAEFVHTRCFTMQISETAYRHLKEECCNDSEKVCADCD